MNPGTPPDKAFERLKVRSLLAWIMAGLTLFIMTGWVVGYEHDDPVAEYLLLVFMTIWPVFWLRRKLKLIGFSWKTFAGPLRSRPKWVQWILITVGALVFSVGCLYLLWYLLSFVSPDFVKAFFLDDNLFFMSDGTPVPPVWLGIDLVLAVFIAPFIEEFIFRGVIFRRWAFKWGVRKSLILSSLLFGLLHLDQIGAIFFGFVMAVLYLQTRSLWVPVFCHSLNNLIACLMAGIGYWAKGPVAPTIAEFRSEAWIGLICFLATAPWVVHYVARHWPPGDKPGHSPGRPGDAAVKTFDGF